MSRKDGKEEVTQAEAARRLGISPQALGVYARKPGAPIKPKKDGTFACLWPDFPRWRDEQMRAKAKDKEGAASLTESMKKFEEAKAQKMVLEVARMQGEVMLTAAIQEQLDQFCGGLMSVLTGRLTRFERDIVRANTPGQARMVTDAIRDQLAQVALEYAGTFDDKKVEAA